MFTRFTISCAPNKKYLSTAARTKYLLDYGLKLAQNNITGILKGPTGEEVTKDVNLSGKTCLITGANSGIGLEMARCLSGRGCTVLTACRNTYAADVATKNVCKDSHLLRHYETNLASLRSVKRCSDDILKTEKKIDIVMLNAGVFGLPWTLTVDKLETAFQVNYLSQFYLLMNIEKLLAPDARVVFTSAESHRNIKWSFHDKMLPTENIVSLPKEQYTSVKAYNVSKLCGILAMHCLKYRWANTERSVLCAHPGSFVKTRLCRNWWPFEVLYSSMLPFSKNIVSKPGPLDLTPSLKGLTGMYFKDCKHVVPSPLAEDSHLAFRMMDLSQDLLRERSAQLTSEEAVKADEPVITVPEAKADIEETLAPQYLRNF